MGDRLSFVDVHDEALMENILNHRVYDNGCKYFISKLYDLPDCDGIFYRGIYLEDKKFRMRKVKTFNGHTASRKQDGKIETRDGHHCYVPLRVLDKLTWIIASRNVGEDKKSKWLYKPQFLENYMGGCQKVYAFGKPCYDVTGLSPWSILSGLGREEHDLDQYNHKPSGFIRHLPWEESKASWGWGDEFDGKQVIALCYLYPKMTYKQIIERLAAEGATVDAQGIVHKKGNK